MTLTMISIFSVAVILVLAFLATRYKQVKGTGEVLIKTPMGSKSKVVSFNGMFIWPLVNRLERMNITKKHIPLIREGSKDKSADTQGLHCKDNIRADLRVSFYIGVNPDPADILLIANNLTAEGANNLETLEAHLSPKFSEALKTAIKQFDFEELYVSRTKFRDAVKALLENDIEGFKLYDVVIDKIEQTPLEFLDPNNVLDADGIRKITEQTSSKNIITTELREKESTEKRRKEVDGQQAREQLERALAETKAKVHREKEHIRLEEEKNIQIKEEETKLEIEKIKIANDQILQIEEEQALREVEVVKINNKKVVEIQREVVERAQQVEKVVTEREVLEKTIDNKKFEEGQNAEIATIVAQRTSTEKDIVIQQEQTKDIQVKSEVERQNIALIANTDAQVQAESIKTVKIAQAQKEASQIKAEAETIQAAGNLQVAEKESERIRLLALAQKDATISNGQAEAERIKALADAEKESIMAKGEAEAVVQIRTAEAIKVKGEAEAQSLQAKGQAEATVVESVGLAKANATKAEYQAMDAISGEVRQHELNKIQAEADRDVRIAEVQSQVQIATKNAEVMAEAMKKANIQILGDSNVFDQIRNSVISGKALDAKIDNSELLTAALRPYKDGEKDLVQDIKDVLQKSEVSTGDVGKIALAKIISENPSILNALTSFVNK